MYKFEKSLASKRQWPGSHAKNTIKNGHIMLEFEFWNFTPTKTQRTALVHRRLDASLSTRIRLKERQGKDCRSFTSHRRKSGHMQTELDFTVTPKITTPLPCNRQNETKIDSVTIALNMLRPQNCDQSSDKTCHNPSRAAMLLHLEVWTTNEICTQEVK